MSATASTATSNDATTASGLSSNVVTPHRAAVPYEKDMRYYPDMKMFMKVRRYHICIHAIFFRVNLLNKHIQTLVHV